MKRYAALLRGVNVGGIKLSMADQRAVAEQVGYRSPVTILNTGNLLIKTDHSPEQLRDNLERALSQYMLRPMHCLIRDLEALDALIQEARPADPNTHHYVLFCDQPLFDELKDQYQQYAHAAGEALYATGQDIHWLVRKGNTLEGFGSKVLSNSKYKALLTSRNLNTVKKIVERLRQM